MNTKSKYEIKKESIMDEIKTRKGSVKEMISCLDEWKDSEEIRKILIEQIRKANFNIKMLETKLKVMDAIKGFKTKVTTICEG